MVGSHRAAEVRCQLATIVVVDSARPLDRSQDVADSSQFGGEVRIVVERTWLRVLDNTVVVGTAMLTNRFISIAEVAV